MRKPPRTGTTALAGNGAPACSGAVERIHGDCLSCRMHRYDAFDALHPDRGGSVPASQRLIGECRVGLERPPIGCAGIWHQSRPSRWVGAGQRGEGVAGSREQVCRRARSPGLRQTRGPRLQPNIASAGGDGAIRAEKSEDARGALVDCAALVAISDWKPMVASR